MVPDPRSVDQWKYSLPHPDCNALLHNLNLAREQVWEGQATRTMFDRRGQHTVTTKPISHATPSGNQRYLKVEIAANTSTAEGTQTQGNKTLPGPGCPVTVRFVDERGVPTLLKGVVVDDMTPVTH